MTHKSLTFCPLEPCLNARLRRRVRVSSSTQMATASKAKRMLSRYDFHIFSWKSLHRGQWSDDRAAGYGVFQYSNGNRYEGQWLDDKRQKLRGQKCQKPLVKCPANQLYKSVARSRPRCLCMCRGFLLALMQLVHNRIILSSERWSQALPQSCLLHILQLLSCLS